MSTSAHFWIGDGDHAEYVGSVFFDGYPEGIAVEVLRATAPSEFRRAVQRFTKQRVGQVGTFAEMRKAASYSYCLVGDIVRGYRQNGKSFSPLGDELAEAGFGLQFAEVQALLAILTPETDPTAAETQRRVADVLGQAATDGLLRRLGSWYHEASANKA